MDEHGVDTVATLTGDTGWCLLPSGWRTLGWHTPWSDGRAFPGEPGLDRALEHAFERHLSANLVDARGRFSRALT